MHGGGNYPNVRLNFLQVDVEAGSFWVESSTMDVIRELAPPSIRAVSGGNTVQVGISQGNILLPSDNVRVDSLHNGCTFSGSASRFWDSYTAVRRYECFQTLYLDAPKCFATTTTYIRTTSHQATSPPNFHRPLPVWHLAIPTNDELSIDAFQPPPLICTHGAPRRGKRSFNVFPLNHNLLL